MLEAVHTGQPIVVGLLLVAERVIEMPGELLVAEPGLARLTVRLGEHSAVTIAGDADAAFMDDGVVPLAEQDQIVQVGAAAGTPGQPMMSLQMPDGVAAGVLTHPVADHQRRALRCADQPSSPTQRQHSAVPIDDRTQQGLSQGQLLRGRGFDRADTC